MVDIYLVQSEADVHDDDFGALTFSVLMFLITWEYSDQCSVAMRRSVMAIPATPSLAGTYQFSTWESSA
jgi:hypothetical protein